jgi:hypothetical protein
MSTNPKKADAHFWRWIGFAFTVGAGVGFVAGVAAIFVLEALISYVP